MKKLLLTILISLSSLVVGLAQTYYVQDIADNSNASDSNAGTDIVRAISYCTLRTQSYIKACFFVNRGPAPLVGKIYSTLVKLLNKYETAITLPVTSSGVTIALNQQ